MANSAAARAFRAAEEAPAAVECAEEWRLAVCSAATNRPVRWALITPDGRHNGAVAVQGITQPTAVYHALVQGLTLAQQQPGAAAAAVRVISNYELIVKQGRGEWRVKNPDQRELALQVADIRRELCGMLFEFAPTEAVLELIG
jgi:ribonuclease HI